MQAEEYKYLDEFRELFNLYENRMVNLEALVHSNYMDFVKYADDSPKSSDQWFEGRLRALEHKQDLLFKMIVAIQPDSEFTFDERLNIVEYQVKMLREMLK